MTARKRHAILVQLLDGDVGAAQDSAIRSAARTGDLSAKLRSVLLAHVGRSDLDMATVRSRRQSREDHTHANGDYCAACYERPEPATPPRRVRGT